MYARVIIKYYGRQYRVLKKNPKPRVSSARTQSRQVTALLLALLQKHKVWFGIRWAKETIALDECQKVAKHNVRLTAPEGEEKEYVSSVKHISSHNSTTVRGLHVCVCGTAVCVHVLYVFRTLAVFLNNLWQNHIATHKYTRFSPWATDSEMSNEAGLWTQAWFMLYWISKACTHLLEQECSHLWHSLEGLLTTSRNKPYVTPRQDSVSSFYISTHRHLHTHSQQSKHFFARKTHHINKPHAMQLNKVLWWFFSFVHI